MHDPATSDWLDLMLEEIERKAEENAAAREEAERRRNAVDRDQREQESNDQPAGRST